MVPARGRLAAALPAALAALALFTAPVQAAARPAVVGHLEGEINSVTASYVAETVARAAREGASALLLVIDTPGGYSSSMDDITKSLLASPVPTLAFVYPPGARAASAGLFVAQACDLVAMAPGTNIGSAHPISSTGANLGGDLGLKVLNDAVARIRYLASRGGRNADWAEAAVRQSVNVGSAEAVRLHVADFEASSLGAALEAADGRSLPRAGGGSVTVATAGAPLEDAPMSAVQVGLHALIDPNVAYLLMLVAAFGLIGEITSPGAILPGVVGGISAILALVALSSLPLNLAGVLLMLLAFLLFLADVKAQTHGILTVGGLISLLLGSFLLIDVAPFGFGVNPWLVAAAAGLAAAVFGFVIRKAAGARSPHTKAGAAALLGTIGEARGELALEGSVFVAGSTWPAVAAGPLPAGTPIRVVGREGAKLRVEALHPRRPAEPGASS